jgi:hypothetical protein
MPDPVTFEIAPEGQAWALLRDGRRLAGFSHVERATHEAVELARELDRSGEPARVLLRPAEGKVIEVDTEPRARDAPPPFDDGADRSRT